MNCLNCIHRKKVTKKVELEVYYWSTTNSFCTLNPVWEIVKDEHYCSHFKEFVDTHILPLPSEEYEKNLLLEKSIDALNLTVRTENCLRGYEVDTIKELINYTKRELLTTSGLGPCSVREIISALENINLKLKE